PPVAFELLGDELECTSLVLWPIHADGVLEQQQRLLERAERRLGRRGRQWPRRWKLGGVRPGDVRERERPQRRRERAEKQQRDEHAGADPHRGRGERQE